MVEESVSRGNACIPADKPFLLRVTVNAINCACRSASICGILKATGKRCLCFYSGKQNHYYCCHYDTHVNPVLCYKITAYLHNEKSNLLILCPHYHLWT